MRTNYKPAKLYAALFVSLMVIMSIAPAFALKRSENILEYAKGNEVTTGGFKNSRDPSVSTASEVGTFANVFLILKFGSLDDFNNFSASEWLKDQANFQSARYNYQETYYALAGLNLISTANVSDTEKNFIYEKFQEKNVLSKFKPNGTDIPTIATTYYGLMIYTYLGKADVLSYDEIGSYVVSMYNADVGGFKSHSTGEVSIENTYYAIKMLVQMNLLSLLTETQKEEIKTYVKSFYVNNSVYNEHYGGFSRTQNNPISTMSMTFYATQILSDLGEKPSEATKKWVLSLQDPSGGFKETFSEASLLPTALATYYAVSTLDLTGYKYDEQVWKFEISPWWIAAIVVACVLAVAGIIYAIYYYKNR